MKHHKLNTKLFKFLALLAILFSLPLLAVGRTVLEAGASQISQIQLLKHPPAIILPAKAHNPSVPRAGSDWPTYLHDTARTSASNETILAPNTVGNLTKLWSFKTGDGIAASSIVVNGTVFVGSWDGYEYALDEATGSLQWKTYLGRTVVDKFCYPLTIGITSSATVQDGVVYVGGGDAYWYALDAKTGAVLWKVYTGDNSSAGGHYNWSSPLLYNGYAYIGIASNCDAPLVQGEVLQVDLKTHQVVHTFETVPKGRIGGGIWTSPSVDPATNSLFFTSGTENNPAGVPVETLAQAVFVLDATTLTLKSSWKLPEKEAIGDSDFDTSPILFTNASGTPLVAAINKNGYIYVFNRNNVGAGPVWKQLIDIAGMCPICEQSSVSSNAIGQGRLYVAAGNTKINGVNYRGSVQALDPMTGNFLWQHGETGSVIGALVYANGMIIDGAGSTLEILDARTGARLYSYRTGNLIYASPSLAHGQIFEGSIDGNVYAFGLANTPTSSLSGGACPRGWSCQDVGNPVLVGSQTFSNGGWSISAGGKGISGTSDEFRLISQAVSGDQQLRVKVISQTSTGIGGPLQLGLMIRQNNDPSSPYYAVLFTPRVGIVVQYRYGVGGETIQDIQMPTASLPLYLEIQRRGDLFQAASSTDGDTYTLLPGSNATIVLDSTTNSGIAVSSNNIETLTTAAFSGLTVTLPNANPVLTASPTPCPANWHCDDIGNPKVPGRQYLHNDTWTIVGSGADIWENADQFHYVWQPMSNGNETMSVQIVSQKASGSYAKAGIMVRANTSFSSPYYAVFVESGTVANGNNIAVEIRDRQGLISTQIAGLAGTAPIYLKIVRAGNTFSAYTSVDGVTWTLIPGSTMPLGLGNTPLTGMAVSSHGVNVISTATFDHVEIH